MDARPESADRARWGTSRPRIAPATLGAILARLAHDLEAPILDLRSGLDGLIDKPAHDQTLETRAQIDLMRELSLSLDRLNQDYFDFAAVRSGALRPRIQPTRLSELLGPIEAQYAPLAARRRIAWACRIDALEPTAATDPAWCRRLVRCLVGNALRFTTEGGRVTLSAQSDGQGWSLWVRDTGPGFPKGLQARLDRPFQRQPGTGGRADDDGLDLLLAMALIEGLGGRCALGHAPGEGASVAAHFAAGHPPS